jgi:F-type H+-transporting ATPase subunit gamma
MASMRDIKRRKSSIQSTQQITKAMKLVSTVKLQKAKNRAEQTNPYFNYMYQTVSSMLAKSGNVNHPYLNKGDSTRKAVVVITSNRGLAGGYNSNIVKLVTGNEELSAEDVDIYAIGSKGREALERKGYHIKQDDSPIIESPSYEDAAALCKQILEAFTEGQIGEIYLAYTHFKNTVSHEPTLIKLLPVELSEEEIAQAADSNVLMNYEPNEEEALDMIIPKYVTSLFYGALVEAVASENGARMQAMDSATSNAEDMISDLSLKYNRARQGSITQELTEIIAGASAIS